MKDVEGIAAEYYRKREEKLEKMVEDLIEEAAAQGLDIEELMAMVEDAAWR